jgi:chemotaxis protein methyltransferase CheR
VAVPRVVITSAFFRDGDHWEGLARTVLPELLAARSPLRLWSAGCHQGQEPYSLAILLDELTPGVGHRLLATDRDEGALSRARGRGPFDRSDLGELSPARRERYFEGGGPPFFLAEGIARRVEFCRHDLVSDACEADFDLVLYRNVETTFDPPVSGHVLRKVCAALRPGGVLFVGAMDAVAPLEGLGLVRIDRAFYRKG